MRLRMHVSVCRGKNLPNQPVVLSMGADPKPDDAVGSIHADRSIVQSDSGRPEPTNVLEMERRVCRVGFEQVKGTIGLFANLSGKVVVVGPKIW